MRALPILLGLAAAALAAPPGATSLPSLDSSYAAPSLKELESRARHTFSGLRFVVLRPGKGPLPKSGDLLHVKYIGWTSEGVEFDASNRTGAPYQFNLGQGHVIAGWDQGLADMRKGERRILIIPPELGYGKEGMALVAPNSTLIFDVELVDF